MGNLHIGAAAPRRRLLRHYDQNSSCSHNSTYRCLKKVSKPHTTSDAWKTWPVGFRTPTRQTAHVGPAANHLVASALVLVSLQHDFNDKWRLFRPCDQNSSVGCSKTDLLPLRNLTSRLSAPLPTIVGAGVFVDNLIQISWRHRTLFFLLPPAPHSGQVPTTRCNTKNKARTGTQ